MVKNKKLLITGVAGFIGSHLADKLLEEGAIVTGIDNLTEGDMDNLEEAKKNPNFTFKQGDIRDKAFLESIMEDIEIIFHLAAFASVTKSVKFPEECNEINVTGTLSLLEVARTHNVKKFIYSSSAAVYGDTSVLPIDESVHPVPKSPYGISKLTAEQYVLVYNDLYEIDTIALRYFNAYGSAEKLSEYSGVIMFFLERLKNNEDLTIYGDGKVTRDFVFVSDIVNANLLAAESSANGHMFNIATNTPTSMKSLAETMIKITGNKNTIHYKPARKGEIIHSYASYEKASVLLKFKPKTSMEEGLKKIIDWYMKK